MYDETNNRKCCGCGNPWKFGRRKSGVKICCDAGVIRPGNHIGGYCTNCCTNCKPKPIRKITTIEEKRIDTALQIAKSYGGIDGAHHKAWVIDQMVRALTNTAYHEFVKEAKAGEDGPETYDWDEGIAP